MRRVPVAIGFVLVAMPVFAVASTRVRGAQRNADMAYAPGMMGLGRRGYGIRTAPYTPPAPPVPTRPGIPRVRQLRIDVSGPLAPPAVRRVLGGATGAVTECYANGRAVRPTLTGEVRVRFVVGPDGRVTATTVIESTLTAHPDTAQCIAIAMRTLAFAPPTGGRSVVVTAGYALDLLARGAPVAPTRGGLTTSRVPHPRRPPARPTGG